jgi:uncharacterized membrane protein
MMRTRRGIWRGVIVGSLVASVILNFGETVLHGVVFAAQWQAAVALLGRTLDQSLGAWALIVVGNSIHCVALVGLGALIGARVESNTKVALVAGVAVWAVGWLAPTLGALPLRLFPPWMWGVVLGAGFVELIVAAFLGLWAYRWCAETMPRRPGPVSRAV